MVVRIWRALLLMGVADDYERCVSIYGVSFRYIWEFCGHGRMRVNDWNYMFNLFQYLCSHFVLSKCHISYSDILHLCKTSEACVMFLSNRITPQYYMTFQWYSRLCITTFNSVITLASNFVKDFRRWMASSAIRWNTNSSRFKWVEGLSGDRWSWHQRQTWRD